MVAVRTQELRKFIHLRDTGRPQDLAAYYVRSARLRTATNIERASGFTPNGPFSFDDGRKILLSFRHSEIEWLLAVMSLLKWTYEDK